MDVMTSPPSDARLKRAKRIGEIVRWPNVHQLFQRKLLTTLSSTAVAEARSGGQWRCPNSSWTQMRFTATPVSPTTPKRKRRFQSSQPSSRESIVQLSTPRACQRERHRGKHCTKWTHRARVAYQALDPTKP